MSTALVSIRNVVKHFDISGGLLEQLRFSGGRPTLKRTVVHALNNVSLDVRQGETLAVVGESGCGKSTLARAVVCLHQPNSGEIRYRDQRIDHLPPAKLLPFRTRLQMIFQDPYASLNPRMPVQRILEEPLRFHHPNLNAAQVAERVAAVMEQVGVRASWAKQYPHEFSGGQRQRISIARALIVDPECIVADEPISALDVSIQAQILNLMMDLQESHNLTYLFISHDLNVVRRIATRVAVMYLGSLCELATARQLFETPRHPYTQALLSAIPTLGRGRRKRIRLTGELSTPINLPRGCVFHPRCPYAYEPCRLEVPSPLTQPDGAVVACHALRDGRI
ncbi:ABC transporter ATP-binding protein [Megalodesulfovibrio gigas]|uniref:Putative oligopeptide/dipeptide ABC transporter ATP-binding protein n=1 Tax=Megalodesulfovibrio gigas (strain ATCC 19364 / DSM 1382 / NCIMB 9332 / VKM B-1759) TaxID=1121448 RepID=T2GAU4_MEGG1|nr:oligopeptide/dipeptide ABC transporter ATP-binding protein [Megalodesulfovibrio gigas]AGW13299.1 putative oligopeptide/dipeptide ABC transporter ATP-binding protein [Megalodesulfovibrio gigas DSM 1382 = ATCC 19364]